MAGLMWLGLRGCFIGLVSDVAHRREGARQACVPCSVGKEGKSFECQEDLYRLL